MGLKLANSKLFEKYGPYVRSLASGIRKQFGLRVDLDDLVSYGNVGLLEAAERFDANLNASFLTFAHYRIKGAIFDGLRRMGAFRGPEQRAFYLSERATNYLSSAATREVAGAHTFQDDVHDLDNAVTSLATIFAVSLEGFDDLQVGDDRMSPEERLELDQLKKRVRVAVERLPANERQLLLAYYYQGRTLEEAGKTIAQSKSWASRLHARAIERLKGFLAEEAEALGEEPLPRVDTGEFPSSKSLPEPRSSRS